ncbi:hypothetical protein GGR52DRAFT_569557 [Hypoxylon sp. FL1284]|nr:hypothetical protein GGR52DRAFT_569557 [Hypoxylon sp. FL1284]
MKSSARPESLYLSELLSARQCPQVAKGLGVFAKCRLTKGLRLLDEPPVLNYATTLIAQRQIARKFQSWRPLEQLTFTRLYAGRNDSVPILRAMRLNELRYATITSRLKSIVGLNSIEKQGTGSFLAIACSFLNHSCVPNAWVYYNVDTRRVTLHALCDIAEGEEDFVCKCRACLSEDSDKQRVAMKDTRARIAANYKARDEDPVQWKEHDIYETLNLLRHLVTLLEEEGLYGLEMSHLLVEQRNLVAELGDEDSRSRKHSKALQLRLLCLGIDHWSTIQMARESRQLRQRRSARCTSPPSL